MKVCLDAGHGHNAYGKPTGARGSGLIEDDWAKAFCDRLGHYLRANHAEVVFSRPSNQIEALSHRGKFAVAEKCDLFLSIHLNASGQSSANGCEAFVADGDVRPKGLALALLAEISLKGMRNRGTKWDFESQYRSLTVLQTTHTHMSAILLEAGFLSNPHDSALLSDRVWVENLASALASCIVRHCPKASQ